MSRLFFILILTAGWQLSAEVYTSVKIPSAAGWNTFSAADWHRSLGLEEYWRENFFCNSVEYIIAGGISRLGTEDFINYFSSLHPFPAVTVASDGVLFKWQNSDGFEQRLWWRPPSGEFPGIWFHIELPGRGAERVYWPSEIPCGGGMRPERIMTFPERNAVWLEFSIPAVDEVQTFRVLSGALYADGWESLSLEGNLPWATGEMLFNPHRKLIALTGTSGNGRGYIYFRQY